MPIMNLKLFQKDFIAVSEENMYWKELIAIADLLCVIFRVIFFRTYFPPRENCFTVRPGQRCSWRWHQHNSNERWRLLYLDIEGWGTGHVTIVEGSFSVEWSTFHKTQDHGKTGNKENLQVRNNFEMSSIKLDSFYLLKCSKMLHLLEMFDYYRNVGFKYHSR